MSLIETLKAWARGRKRTAPAGERLPGEAWPDNSEKGRRATPEASLRYLYRQMFVDPELRAAILEIRQMEKLDGRVRRIHSRVARDMVRGGLMLTQKGPGEVLRREWDAFMNRLQLDRIEKLKSDARGLVMEGNLPLQWVLDQSLQVVAGVRMPTETLVPVIDTNGRFKDPSAAYKQIDPATAEPLATFGLWQLSVVRFDPDNYDDMGSFGRPFLDAGRTTWRKLCMTEEDLVIRRRTRAPFRMAHVLEGATDDEIDKYRASIERDQRQITTDFYLNRKGSVSPVQGDASLAEIGDVVYLLDTFFAGTPLPKGLMGYTDGMARDILEDLKRDYYEEIDVLQDTQSAAYAQGFRLHLLLKGIAPDPSEYRIEFAQQRTETRNQIADLMLKWQALQIPKEMIYTEMGKDAQAVIAQQQKEAKETDPYPDGTGSIGPDLQGEHTPGPVRVSITPGNAPKGESATSTTHSNRLGEYWPEEAE